MYKGLPTFLQKPWQSVPRVKGSYYVVNRVLYSYMYDYATFMKKRKICCINTEISRFITTAFPQTVATTPHYSSGLLIERTRGPIHDYLLFSPLFLFHPDRAVFAYIISHAYHQRKTRKEKR
jgi:hypothetical protein